MYRESISSLSLAEFHGRRLKGAIWLGQITSQICKCVDDSVAFIVGNSEGSSWRNRIREIEKLSAPQEDHGAISSAFIFLSISNEIQKEIVRSDEREDWRAGNLHRTNNSM